jgi:hypothetical protein
MMERQRIALENGYAYEAYIHSGLICIRPILPFTGHWLFSRKLESRPGFWRGHDLTPFVEELDGVLYELKITTLKHNLEAGQWTCRWRPPKGRHE